MIGEVVSLRTELEAGLPVNGEGLNQRDIPVRQAGRINIIANATLQIEGSGRGRSPDRRSVAIGRAEPLRATCTAVGAGKFVGTHHRSVLHPELAHGSGRNI